MKAETSRQFDNLLRTGDGVFAVDQEQRIISWNVGAQSILGYAPEETMGRYCYEIISGNSESGEIGCVKDCPIVDCRLDDVWERGTCFGSSERVADLMKQYMHRIGATSFMCQMRIGGLEHKKVLRSMELFAKEVMPALREEEEKMASAVTV